MARRSPSRQPSADPQALLASTTVAAFASDASGRITVWNRAAEALLGHEASRVVGARCCNVIRGRDLFGNRFCNDSCAVRKMRRRREPIHPYAFRVMHRSGKMLAVKCSIIVSPGARVRQFNLIHLMEPLDSASEVASDGVRRGSLAAREFGTAPNTPEPETPKRLQKLTPREIEVLRLVASGTCTEDIARVLGIQTTTTRNHIQHILSKLGAHTKLQAACIAQRSGLL